jgi:hypothetical protein
MVPFRVLKTLESKYSQVMEMMEGLKDKVKSHCR